MCPSGTPDQFNEDSTDIFDVSGIEDGNRLVGDVPVELEPNTQIVLSQSPNIKPGFIPMDLAITVEDVNTVTFKFYAENGTLVKTVNVSKLYPAFGSKNRNH